MRALLLIFSSIPEPASYYCNDWSLTFSPYLTIKRGILIVFSSFRIYFAGQFHLLGLCEWTSESLILSHSNYPLPYVSHQKNENKNATTKPGVILSEIALDL